MPSTTEILRNACAANDLATSGSASVLLNRLVNASTKKPSEAKSMKPATRIKKGTSTIKVQGKKNETRSKDKGKDRGKSNGKVGRPLGSKKKSMAAAAKSTTKKHTPVKATANGGVRLSAAYYFHEICGHSLSRCNPQMITQNDGSNKMKEIRLVQGAHGLYPKWVLVK